MRGKRSISTDSLTGTVNLRLGPRGGAQYVVLEDALDPNSWGSVNRVALELLDLIRTVLASLVSVLLIILAQDPHR